MDAGHGGWRQACKASSAAITNTAETTIDPTRTIPPTSNREFPLQVPLPVLVHYLGCVQCLGLAPKHSHEKNSPQDACVHEIMMLA